MTNSSPSSKALALAENANLAYQIESANLMSEFRISLAMAIGDKNGNPDLATATKEITACNARIAQGFALGAFHETPVKAKRKVSNPLRALDEFKAETIREGRVSLLMQKRRAIKLANGIPFACDKVATARLGIADKAEHVEKDGITRDKLATAKSPCLAIVAATVIKTINTPKGYVKQGDTLAEKGDFILPDKAASKAQRKASREGKTRRKISPLEECEVFQTVAMVLIANDALHLEIDGSETWRGVNGLWGKIYSACRDSLGIDRMGYAEISLPDHDPIFTLQESIRTGYDAESIARAKIKLAEIVAEWQRAIRLYAMYSSDAKRKANAKNASATLRAMTEGQFSISDLSKAEMEAKSKSKARLETCVAYGKRWMEAEKKDQAKRTLEKEIAMAMHAQFCASCV